MIRKLAIVGTAIATLALTVAVTAAGSPHFVGDCTKVQNADNSITVTCKEAGLGNEAQIQVTISATALCINGGGNHPKAVNKLDVAQTFDEPVQNGKANYTETLTASFQPPCDPPMTVQWSNVTVTDTTNGLTVDP
jgi:uncharacterized cupredoxin-like copper-binding protein